MCSLPACAPFAWDALFLLLDLANSQLFFKIQVLSPSSLKPCSTPPGRLNHVLSVFLWQRMWHVMPFTINHVRSLFRCICLSQSRPVRTAQCGSSHSRPRSPKPQLCHSPTVWPWANSLPPSPRLQTWGTMSVFAHMVVWRITWEKPTYAIVRVAETPWVLSKR